jgi:hypothetical protein
MFKRCNVNWSCDSRLTGKNRRTWEGYVFGHILMKSWIIENMFIMASIPSLWVPVNSSQLIATDTSFPVHCRGTNLRKDSLWLRFILERCILSPARWDLSSFGISINCLRIPHLCTNVGRMAHGSRYSGHWWLELPGVMPPYNPSNQANWVFQFSSKCVFLDFKRRHLWWVIVHMFILSHRRCTVGKRWLHRRLSFKIYNRHGYSHRGSPFFDCW